MDWQVKHFKPSEFDCHHCGRNRMDELFLAQLDRLREECGFPFPVTSGYRCPEHNNAVSSTGYDGPHTTGRAVDIGVRGQQAVELISKAIASGFTGIGIQQKGAARFIHLDDLPNADRQPRPTVWSY